MAQLDYYILLNIGQNANQEEIKKAYRKLAIQFHPDRNRGSQLAEEKFKLLAEAYAVLSNPLKRRQYDLLGPVEFKKEFSQESIFQGFEPSDFFKLLLVPESHERLDKLFQGEKKLSTQTESRVRLGNFFSGFGQKHSVRANRSPDIIIPLLVSFREAAFGSEKVVAYNTEHGVQKVPVIVPPAANVNQRIILKGQGPTKNGSQPGDIIVILTVAADPDFTRIGYDIYTDLTLTSEEVTKGCRPVITNLSGHCLRLTVLPGTKVGSSLKVAGHGLMKPDGKKGDLLVRIKA